MRRSHRRFGPRPSRRDALAVAVAVIFAVSACGSSGPTGRLDATFGDGGVVITDVGAKSVSTEAASGLVPTADGGLVAVGTHSRDVVLVKYTASGAIDTAFGVDGVIRTEGLGRPSVEVARSLDDGRILVGGSTGNVVFVLRYQENGDLDRTFGTDGVSRNDLSDEQTASLHALEVRADGRIVVAGSAFVESPGTANVNDFMVGQLMPDGTLDQSFGVGGAVRTFVGPGMSTVRDIALTAEGKIIAAGWTWSTEIEATVGIVARYNLDGSLDTSFGSGGFAEIQSYSGIHLDAVVVDESDRIIVAGTKGDEPVMYRLSPEGTRDTAYGGTVSGETRLAFVTELFPLSDGTYLVIGRERDQMMVRRFDDNGRHIKSFGEGGSLLVSAGTERTIGFALTPHGDGGFVVSGLAKDLDDEESFVLIRFE